MELKIDKYKITSDPLNYMLYEYTTIVSKKDKSERQDYILVGYYPNITHALHEIIDLGIRGIDEANIHMILDSIQQAEKNIMKAVKQYNLQQERFKEGKDEE